LREECAIEGASLGLDPVEWYTISVMVDERGEPAATHWPYRMTHADRGWCAGKESGKFRNAPGGW